MSTGTSHAGLDNELSLVDGQGRTLTIQQWDTFLNGVFPLDRNRLTREWFHSGRAKYTWPGRVRRVRGHVGAGLPDRLPVVAGCGHQLQLHHAQHPARRSAIAGIEPVRSVGHHARTCSRVCRSALTWATARASRRWRPSRWTSPVPHGGVAVSNAHGTVTGAAGGVLLRPFARLISKAGDSVTTYGEPWNMN